MFMRSFCIALLLSSVALGQTSAPASSASVEPVKASATEQRTDVLVPGGTKVALALKQTISTKTAKQGDPVYAETAFPVVENGRMLIPAGTYVQGVIDRVRRGGRVHGKAELLMHFNTLIYPNGYTVMMPAGVEKVPGAAHEKMKGEEGTIQEEGQTG